MKTKHVPEKIREEIHVMDWPVKKIVKESIHKCDDWKNAKKYVKDSLELLIYQANEAMRKICN
jgi:hypothetical protein